MKIDRQIPRIDGIKINMTKFCNVHQYLSALEMFSEAIYSLLILFKMISDERNCRDDSNKGLMRPFFIEFEKDDEAIKEQIIIQLNRLFQFKYDIDYLKGLLDNKKVLFLDRNNVLAYINDRPFNHEISYLLKNCLNQNAVSITEFIAMPLEFLQTDDMVVNTQVVDRLYAYNAISMKLVRLFESNVLNRYVNTIEPKSYNLKNNNEVISIEDVKSVFTFLKSADILYTIENNSKEYKLKSNPYFFNPNMAKIFNGNVVDVKTIIDMLGEKESTIKANIDKLLVDKKNLVVVGLGGSMSNFVHWCERLVEYFNIKEPLFHQVICFEHDELELSNLFRIPLDYLSPIFYTNEVNRNKYSKAMMLKNTKYFSEEYVIYNEMLDGFHKIERLKQSFDYVIGSPNLHTRELLHKHDVNFICPLHSNNDLFVYEKPNMANFELTVETYGQINLTWFFLNMFKMTIECLDIMANKPELDKDVLRLKYSSKEIDIKKNLKKAKSNKTIILY